MEVLCVKTLLAIIGGALGPMRFLWMHALVLYLNQPIGSEALQTVAMASASSDELLAIIVPIFLYWAYSGLYMLLGDSLGSYRLHSREDEDAKNTVSKRKVAIGVLLQQMVQAAIFFLVLNATRGDHSNAEAEHKSLFALLQQLFIGMFVLDTWHYFWHRYLHLNKFLYRHVHSWHHRLIVPYAFGSQYNHPLEGLILDTLGGALAFLASGMSPRASIFFFAFGTMKGIDDHCGLWLPGNVFHMLFWNNTAYHDIHHQLYGSKYNFSQPFFVTWDKILGTYMPYTVEKRAGGGGGLEARPSKNFRQKGV